MGGGGMGFLLYRCVLIFLGFWPGDLHLPDFSPAELALRSLPAVGAKALAVLLALPVVLAASSMGGAVEGGRAVESAEAAVEEEQREEEQAFSPVLRIECGWGAAPVWLLQRLLRQAHDSLSWFRYSPPPQLQLHIVVVVVLLSGESFDFRDYCTIFLWAFLPGLFFFFCNLCNSGQPKAPRSHTHTQAHPLWTHTHSHSRTRLHNKQYWRKETTTCIQRLAKLLTI